LDIDIWLRGIGLSQYAAVFRSNEIDASLLRGLSSDDLKEMGIAALGHRKKLLEAIAELTAAPNTSPTSTGGTNASAVGMTAERRQLTVMFSDLVGSSTFANRSDPEETRAVLRSFHTAVVDAVAPFEGHVAQLLGDGVLVYFGYPRAHEDDPARAVRAALAVLAAVAGLDTSGSAGTLQTRIGIATGLVVIGQIGEGTPANEHSASGETPNLAARLQAIAAPGEIVLSQTTQQLLDASFELSPLGLLSVKGFDAPLPAWRVLSERSLASRFEAQHERAASRLIGRDSEVALLLDRWALAREGEAQVVLLCGEAGIGKSRIGQALRERLAGEEHASVVLQCSPYFSGSALYPVVRHLRLAAGIANTDSATQQRRKISQMAAALAPEGQAAVLRLMGLADQDLSAEEAQMPQQQKARTLNALVDLMNDLAQRQPVWLWIEDAHWIDPTTQELLALLIDRLRDARLFALATIRPEATLNLGKPAHLTTLTLNRLGQRQCAALIDAVAQGQSLPQEVQAQIIRKTDGVPLFVEELTKTVLQSGLLEPAQTGYRLAAPLPELAIPSTLQDSLMARLDRLTQAKEVAQAAAAIGREFTRSLLQAVLQGDSADLDKSLSELEAADLLIRRGEDQSASYSFKHALVRDTAYNSMLKTQRALRHGQIAQALEEFEHGTVAGRPELLAHHYQEAGDTRRASELWTEAGHLAVTRGANPEAAAAFERALGLLERLPQSTQTDTAALDIRNALGPVLWALHGFRSPQAEASYRQALALAERLGDQPRRFQAHWGLNYVRFVAGRYAEALQSATLLLEIASRDDDGAEQLEAHHAMWGPLMGMGRPHEALVHLERGSALYQAERHGYLRYRYAGHDPEACCSGSRAVCNWLIGFPARAKRDVTAFRASVERLEHPLTSVGLPQVGWVLYQLGEVEAAVRVGDELTALANRHGLQVRAESLFILRELPRLGTHTPTQLRQLHERLAKARSAHILILWMTSILLDLCVQAGDLELAHAVLEPLLGIRDTLHRAEFLCTQGALLLRRATPDPAAAERSFKTAIEVAREQGAKSFELRAATSLASLWHEQGKPIEACELLGGVYGWFTEGFDTPDLRRAKSLLDAWAGA
jgi:class 3 adenylate cyclase/tetratricopeptide (TPR) repeat protein